MIYYWDKKLKKWLYVLEADIITILKNIDLITLAERVHFLQDMVQTSVVSLVSVINHYHIYGLHLFWDILNVNRGFCIEYPTAVDMPENPANETTTSLEEFEQRIIFALETVSEDMRRYW